MRDLEENKTTKDKKVYNQEKQSNKETKKIYEKYNTVSNSKFYKNDQYIDYFFSMVDLASGNELKENNYIRPKGLNDYKHNNKNLIFNKAKPDKTIVSKIEENYSKYFTQSHQKCPEEPSQDKCSLSASTEESTYAQDNDFKDVIEFALDDIFKRPLDDRSEFKDAIEQQVYKKSSSFMDVEEYTDTSKELMGYVDFSQKHITQTQSLYFETKTLCEEIQDGIVFKDALECESNRLYDETFNKCEDDSYEFKDVLEDNTNEKYKSIYMDRKYETEEREECIQKKNTTCGQLQFKMSIVQKSDIREHTNILSIANNAEYDLKEMLYVDIDHDHRRFELKDDNRECLKYTCECDDNKNKWSELKKNISDIIKKEKEIENNESKEKLNRTRIKKEKSKEKLPKTPSETWNSIISQLTKTGRISISGLSDKIKRGKTPKNIKVLKYAPPDFFDIYEEDEENESEIGTNRLLNVKEEKFRTDDAIYSNYKDNENNVEDKSKRLVKRYGKTQKTGEKEDFEHNSDETLIIGIDALMEDILRKKTHASQEEKDTAETDISQETETTADVFKSSKSRTGVENLNKKGHDIPDDFLEDPSTNAKIRDTFQSVVEIDEKYADKNDINKKRANDDKYHTNVSVKDAEHKRYENYEGVRSGHRADTSLRENSQQTFDIVKSSKLRDGEKRKNNETEKMTDNFQQGSSTYEFDEEFENTNSIDGRNEMMNEENNLHFYIGNKSASSKSSVRDEKNMKNEKEKREKKEKKDNKDVKNEKNSKYKKNDRDQYDLNDANDRQDGEKRHIGRKNIKDENVEDYGEYDVSEEDALLRKYSPDTPDILMSQNLQLDEITANNKIGRRTKTLIKESTSYAEGHDTFENTIAINGRNNFESQGDITYDIDKTSNNHVAGKNDNKSKKESKENVGKKEKKDKKEKKVNEDKKEKNDKKDKKEKKESEDKKEKKDKKENEDKKEKILEILDKTDDQLDTLENKTQIELFEIPEADEEKEIKIPEDQKEKEDNEKLVGSPVDTNNVEQINVTSLQENDTTPNEDDGLTPLKKSTTQSLNDLSESYENVNSWTNPGSNTKVKKLRSPQDELIARRPEVTGVSSESLQNAKRDLDNKSSQEKTPKRTKNIDNNKDLNRKVDSDKKIGKRKKDRYYRGKEKDEKPNDVVFDMKTLSYGTSGVCGRVCDQTSCSATITEARRILVNSRSIKAAFLRHHMSIMKNMSTYGPYTTKYDPATGVAFTPCGSEKFPLEKRPACSSCSAAARDRACHPRHLDPSKACKGDDLIQYFLKGKSGSGGNTYDFCPNQKPCSAPSFSFGRKPRLFPKGKCDRHYIPARCKEPFSISKSRSAISERVLDCSSSASKRCSQYYFRNGSVIGVASDECMCVPPNSKVTLNVENVSRKPSSSPCITSSGLSPRYSAWGMYYLDDY